MPNVDIECHCGRNNTVWMAFTQTSKDTVKCECGRTIFYESYLDELLSKKEVGYEVGILRLRKDNKYAQ